MQIIERLAPLGHNCRPGIGRTGFMGVTVHNTSNYSNGANALAHANLLRGGWKDKYVSWHYVIDKDYAVRCIPENETAWCAGDGANGNGNRKTINIEICDNADGDIRKATDNAVELVADILRRNGITTAQGHLFQHNHWTGKDCPYDIRRGNPYDWNTFVAKVQERLNGSKPSPTPSPSPSKKTNEQIADEVIAGKWGNGEDRKKRLAQAGYDYATIQGIVNNKLNGGSSKPVAKKVYVNLPPKYDSWAFYRLTSAPVKKNAIGNLNPKKFGGLSYYVYRYLDNGTTVEIQTVQFGRVKIYIKNTPAIITYDKWLYNAGNH